MRGLKIPFEIADSITRLNLIDHRDYLKKELDNHLKNGEWMHPEDIAQSERILKIIDDVIQYFGGEED